MVAVTREVQGLLPGRIGVLERSHIAELSLCLVSVLKTRTKDSGDILYIDRSIYLGRIPDELPGGLPGIALECES